MNQFYIGISQWTKRHPKVTGCLSIINIIITVLVVALYPAMLVYLLVKRDASLAKAIIVPLDGFIILSAFRYLVNRPRPYEALPIEPAINKKTKGKSFPSRHVYSATAIALTFLLGSPFPYVGIVLAVCAILLAIIRVLTSVHYISDVLVGIGFGVVVAIIGYILIP